jgi:predicted RNA-binding Zn ribbon-like protein
MSVQLSKAGTDDAFGTVLGFVNTRSDPKAGFVERFGNAAGFSDWARERGLLDDEAVSESEAAAARELRSALLAIMLVHANPERMTSQQIDDAERHLAHAGELYPVRMTISRTDSLATGHRRGAGGVFGSVLAAANELVQHSSWGRLKACACDPCENGFADRTKSGNQRYCGSNCASRAAMRAMRERRRGDA